MALRILAIGLLVTALAVTASVLLGSSGGYRVRVELLNASQLVKGNEVRLAGRRVGAVERLALGTRNAAVLTLRIDDDELVPLHGGTTATIRATSLSGVANRYVALVPGPNSRAVLPDGGTIPATDSQAAVELDQILGTFDAQTRSAVQAVVHGAAGALDGAQRDANAALAVLDPALGQLQRTARELTDREPELERLLVSGSAVVGALAPHAQDLERALAGTAAAGSAAARERASLDRALAGAPALLRRADTTLVSLRATLRELDPALDAARPVAPRLAAFLRTLRPAVRDARPAVRGARRLVANVDATLTAFPRTERSATPAIAATTTALDRLAPIVAGARPYAPDVIGGFLGGVGGVTSGYYDANGEYMRIGFAGGPLSTAGLLALPAPPASGTKTGATARCPGGAIGSAPDGSNPFVDEGVNCRRGDTSR